MIYLDNAATTFPKPESVNKAVYDCMVNYCANPGRSGHRLAMKAARAIYDCREAVAELINAENPMEIVFTHNATDSLNLGIKGILNRGDHVITSAIEHNSVIRPIKALEKKGIENTVVKCDGMGFLDYDELEKSFRENTKLVVMTHASNVVGTLIDIEKVSAICKKHNVIFMVDASQTLGVFDIDVRKMGIDILAAPGHKCLFGPQGTGVLYVREGIKLDILKEGGTGSKSEELSMPDLYPDRYEAGTHNTPGIAGLLKGVEFIKETGIENIREHERELCQYMIDGFSKIENVEVYGTHDASKRASVVAINIKNTDSGEVTFRLDREFDIATRSGIHCAPLCHRTIGTLEKGAVRFSIGYFNTEDDIDKAIEAVRKIAAEAM